MESVSWKILIPSTHTITPSIYSANPLQTRSFRTNFRYFPLIIRSKKSNYQDFQEYAKPSRLLPATEVKFCRDAMVENAVTSFMPKRSEALYKIKLQTSNMYGSGLTDVNSGVLVCLIDENGSSILQRLPATSIGTDNLSEDKVSSDNLHFQRGGIDEFAFGGPKLGTIVAIWISLESGQWRLGGLSLTVICQYRPSSADNSQENKQEAGLHYNFDIEDILLGEKSEASMVEFRPYSVTPFSTNDFTSFGEKSLTGPSLGSNPISNEESMKDYADLKYSLLLYDAILILAGCSITSLTTGENTPYAFLTGGTCGFLYLLLLQKSIDELPAPELIPGDGKGSLSQIFGRLKGPIAILVLAFAFAIIMVKYASGEDAIKLTPKDLIFGMMGFLMCKVSVVLAAFKPLPLSLRDNK